MTLIIGGLIFGPLLVMASPLMVIVVSLGFGYLSAYMFKIILSSAGGEEELPDWPDFSDPWDDIIRPLLLVLATIVACCIPASVYLFFFFSPASETDLVLLALIGLGLLYMPMGLLVVSMFNSLLALNPLLVVRSILKIPRDYVIACVVLLLITIANTQTANLPFIGRLITGLASFYFLMVEMRILGLMYQANHERLGWFDGC